MRSARLAPPNTLPPVDVAGVITLDQVRPHPRKQNEYVDTPHSPLIHAGKAIPCTKAVAGGNVAQAPREHVLLPRRTPVPRDIIRQQPVSTSPPLKKDLPSQEDTNIENSIICSKCNKCKCGACTNPRELPSKWLCGVRPEATVKYATCVCCVEGVFYHCSKDDQDAEFECVSDPCACCNRPHCCKRWTCILAMSLCLPCMCLYPPAKLALMCCTGLYNKCRRKGCTCKSTSSSSNQSGKRSRSSGISKLDSTSQSRGLLIDSESSSSNT